MTECLSLDSNPGPLDWQANAIPMSYRAFLPWSCIELVFICHHGEILKFNLSPIHPSPSLSLSLSLFPSSFRIWCCHLTMKLVSTLSPCLICLDYYSSKFQVTCHLCCKLFSKMFCLNSLGIEPRTFAFVSHYLTNWAITTLMKLLVLKLSFKFKSTLSLSLSLPLSLSLSLSLANLTNTFIIHSHCMDKMLNLLSFCKPTSCKNFLTKEVLSFSTFILKIMQR